MYQSMHITIKSWWHLGRRQTKQHKSYYDSSYTLEKPETDKRVYEPRAKGGREEISPPVACQHWSWSPNAEIELANASGRNYSQIRNSRD